MTENPLLFLVKTHHETYMATYGPTGALCAVKESEFGQQFPPVFLYARQRQFKPAVFLIGSNPEKGFFTRPLCFPNWVLPLEMTHGRVPTQVAFKLPGTPHKDRYLAAMPPGRNSHVDLVTCDREWIRDWESFELTEAANSLVGDHVAHQIQAIEEFLTEDTSIFDVYARFCADPDPGTGAQRSIMARFTEALYKFESLGENCEFGFVQRHCGIEPIGLLRFAGDLRTYTLADAIRTRFSAIGTAKDFSCEQIHGNPSEYLIHDYSLGMGYHTWRTSSIGCDQVVVEEEKKLRFLGDKLVEDFEDGEKIFVVTTRQSLDEPGLDAVFDAIRTIGPGTLLSVARADPDHPPGTVIPLRDGHLRGFIGEFAERPYDPDLLEWIHICRNALCVLGR